MSSSDSSSDEEDKVPLERVDTGSSGLYKVKKKLASLTIGTKAGRRVIIGMMGEEGDKLLTALKHAAGKYASKGEAKKLKKSFLKMVMKGKLMFDERRLTPANTMHAAQPINDLALAMVDQFEKASEVEKQGELDVELLSTKMHIVRDLVVELMKPHMQAANTESLTHIFNFYGDQSFLRAVLCEERFAEERDAVKENLTPIAQDIRKRADMFRTQPQKCYLNKCPKLRAPERDDFQGSIYCPHHHLMNVMSELEKPNLAPFLNQTSKASGFFVTFLRAKGEAQNSTDVDDAVDYTVLFRFHDALVQYRRLRNNLRKPRAELINSKFIANRRVSKSIGLSDDVVKQVRSDLQNVRTELNAARSRGTLHHLYDGALEELTKHLQSLFDEFLESSEFQDYVKSVTLPKEMMAEAQRRHTMIPGVDDQARPLV